MLQILSCTGGCNVSCHWGSGPRFVHGSGSHCLAEEVAIVEVCNRNILGLDVRTWLFLLAYPLTLHVIQGKSYPFSGLIICKMQGDTLNVVFTSPKYVDFLLDTLKAKGREEMAGTQG